MAAEDMLEDSISKIKDAEIGQIFSLLSNKLTLKEERISQLENKLEDLESKISDSENSAPKDSSIEDSISKIKDAEIRQIFSLVWNKIGLKEEKITQLEEKLANLESRISESEKSAPKDSSIVENSPIKCVTPQSKRTDVPEGVEREPYSGAIADANFSANNRNASGGKTPTSPRSSEDAAIASRKAGPPPGQTDLHKSGFRLDGGQNDDTRPLRPSSRVLREPGGGSNFSLG